MKTDEILEKLARPGIYVCIWPGSVAFVETDADGVQHQLKPETFERDGVLRRDRWNSGVGSSIHGPFQRAPDAAAAPDVLAMRELEAAQRLFKEALPKFDWGGSALDANAIRLLNEVPAQVARALSAQGEAKPEPRAGKADDDDELTPCFTEHLEALRFLSARFKHAGVSEAVAAIYARDIDAMLAASPIATPEPQEGRKTTNPVPDWMVELPCAMVKDRSSARGAWLYIPHADGQWVSAAKLGEFSLAIIDAWRKEHGITQDGERDHG